MTSQIDLCENYIFGYSISTNLLRNSSHCFVNPIPSKEFNVKGTRELYKEDDWKKYSHFARPIMLGIISKLKY
uniref:Uncharacterized protein n=1 Tax=Meloidogyne enterolobii TaxID=390850 RepID=A0A6V7U6L3_MELEN|nr:unnamed protein product [Meloidogyne enterolobii]